jgi:hypothetical protein
MVHSKILGNSLPRRGEENRHARESGHPGLIRRGEELSGWIPACAGMTAKKNQPIFRPHCFIA